MADRMFGQETEYALAALDRQGRNLGPEEAVMTFMTVARKAFAHLPEPASNGIFLANGGRFYVDCGMHPELTTPEVTSPWEAVRYTSAGDMILGQVAGRMAAEEERIGEIVILKTNVDYVTHNTWGCHESYLHRGDQAEMARHVLPHLLSRLIYTGAGGFDPRHPGIVFTISPRVAHLMTDRSDQSTHSRGIWHTKDESLSSRGFHRAHILCGESLCSQLSEFLKMGTTALVVAMAEGGLCPGDGVSPRAPLEAMRRFAADTEFRCAVDSTEGRKLRAIDIQRHYLSLAEANAGASFMPSWTGEVCGHWRSVLDRLESEPESLSNALDWRIKLGLFKDYAQRQGFSWESLALWSDALLQLNHALTGGDYSDRPVTVEMLRGPDCPIPEQVDVIRRALEERGIDWDQLEAFIHLRDRLFEIDLRFGQVGETGIFLALDGEARLGHRMVAHDEIVRAMTEPPALGRAHVRGECIRRMADRGGPSTPRCAWTSILDVKNGQALDLSDPWQSAEVWRPGTRPDPANPIHDVETQTLFRRARVQFRRAVENRRDE